MSIAIELEREEDGRWLADVPALPGVMAYGADREEALRAVQALALRVIADRLEQGEPVSEALLGAFHDGVELGPRMLSRIAKKTGLEPADL